MQFNMKTLITMYRRVEYNWLSYSWNMEMYEIIIEKIRKYHEYTKEGGEKHD